MIVDEGCFERGCACHDSRESPGVVVVKREWRGLTEEEISAVFPSHLRGDYKDLIPYSFARAIEAALKERNT